MKELKFCGLTLILILLSVNITSCSKEDDMYSDGRGKGALVISDGRTIELNQSVLTTDKRKDYMYIDIIFSNGDIMNLPDKMLHKLQLKIVSYETFFPEGEIPYGWREDTNWYSFTAEDLNPHEEILSEEDIDTGTYYYSEHGEQGNIIITATSKGYKIEIPNITFSKSQDGTNHTDANSEIVTASFVYEGDIENVDRLRPTEQED